MSFQVQKKSSQASSPTTLEVLVFRVDGYWLAVRSSRQFRLLSFEASQLKPGEQAANQTFGQLGTLTRGGISFTVYDLAFLLELKDEPTPPPEGQLVQTLINGQAVGFAIAEAQETRRVPLNEVHSLPEIITRLQTTPAIWAVWSRPDGDLIPLVDLNFVLQKKTSPASQS